MPRPATDPETIRILVASDSHVGYNERDPIRGDDSWKSFDEVMCLAKDQDVDMVLLGGDLFHDNKPSRKSMYQVMRSIRMNCFGEKPCELEMLSDGSEIFQGAFNHVNYEDPDINVAIPVFSIHGNHDDPSGDGHLCALDLLQVSGLVNYYGRTPESDNIHNKPVLLQKGNTKLALYGMSNVRDERLFRTFRDGGVKFFRPSTQRDDWFNLMAVHQNHYAHTETSYLPENFLPDFMDLIVWGHEHECLINPRYNPETSFHVMQPGSSVATSLVPGEAVPKHVAILSVTGREFEVEAHRLKSVRPFATKEVVLNNEKGMKALAKRDNNRSELTRYLEKIVDDMIEKANADWLEAQGEVDEDDELEVPLPLIRLKVEYSAPDGGRFECENPQRFSNRFVGKVANVNDVVYFWRRKATVARNSKADGEMPEDNILAQLAIDNVKVEKLVREFLTAQSLTILPQNSFGDAVSQFVDKDDKHAMEMFVNESLASQIKHLMGADEPDEEDLAGAMEHYRSKLEELFAAGMLKRSGKARLKPKPDNWDSDLDGEWGDQPGALLHSEGDEDEEQDEEPVSTRKTTSRRGRGGKPTAATTRTSAASRKPAAAPSTRVAAAIKSKPKAPKDDDIMMIDNDDDVEVVEEEDEEEEEEEPPPKTRARGGKKAQAPSSSAVSKSQRAKPAPVSSTVTSPVKRQPARNAAASSVGRQSRLNFSQTPAASQSTHTVNGTASNRKVPLHQLSDDDISDDDDDFEPMAAPSRPGRGARR
ncbi:MAG: Double-strand break repair protein mus-23 [Chaenotheca gracillima]|nr:MAG: Double-strand break repair protein mus-23 [Chaenotheca gracillima]